MIFDHDDLMTIIIIITVKTFRRGGRRVIILMNLMVRMTIMSLKAVITLVVASSIYHLLYRTQ